MKNKKEMQEQTTAKEKITKLAELKAQAKAIVLKNSVDEKSLSSLNEHVEDIIIVCGPSKLGVQKALDIFKSIKMAATTANMGAEAAEKIKPELLAVIEVHEKLLQDISLADEKLRKLVRTDLNNMENLFLIKIHYDKVKEKYSDFDLPNSRSPSFNFDFNYWDQKSLATVKGDVAFFLSQKVQPFHGKLFDQKKSTAEIDQLIAACDRFQKLTPLDTEAAIFLNEFRQILVKDPKFSFYSDQRRDFPRLKDYFNKIAARRASEVMVKFAELESLGKMSIDEEKNFYLLVNAIVQQNIKERKPENSISLIANLILQGIKYNNINVAKKLFEDHHTLLNTEMKAAFSDFLKECLNNINDRKITKKPALIAYLLTNLQTLNKGDPGKFQEYILPKEAQPPTLPHKIFTLLFEFGANIKSEDYKDAVALIKFLNKNKLLVKPLPNIDLKERTTGNSALHRAVESGDLELVQILLTAGAKVDVQNNKDNKENTPLHIAAKNGNVSVVTLLLNNGAHMLLNTEGATPLDLVTDNTPISKKIRNLLIPHLPKADEVVPGSTLTRLNQAALQGNMAEVKMLVEALQYDPRDNNKKGEILKEALGYAVHAVNPGIVEYLLKRGAIPTSKIIERVNALKEGGSLDTKQQQLVDLIKNAENKMQVAQQPQKKTAPTTSGATFGLWDIGGPTVKAGPTRMQVVATEAEAPKPPPKPKDIFDRIEEGNSAEVQRLIGSSSEVMKTTKGGQKPLAFALQHHKIDILVALITHAEIEEILAMKSTDKYLTLSQSEKSSVDAAILDKVNTPKKKSAIHEAAESGDKQRMIDLHKLGAALDLQDENGNTPLLYVLGPDNEKMSPENRLMCAQWLVKTFREEHRNLDNKSFYEAINNFINHENKDQKTPLQTSMESGDLKVTQLLLDNGATLAQKPEEHEERLGRLALMGHYGTPATIAVYGYFKTMANADSLQRSFQALNTAAAIEAATANIMKTIEPPPRYGLGQRIVTAFAHIKEHPDRKIQRELLAAAYGSINLNNPDEYSRITSKSQKAEFEKILGALWFITACLERERELDYTKGGRAFNSATSRMSLFIEDQLTRITSKIVPLFPNSSDKLLCMKNYVDSLSEEKKKKIKASPSMKSVLEGAEATKNPIKDRISK